MPEWLDTIDHTADTGFVVSAPDLERLFARAAWALFAVITDVEGVEDRVTRWVRVTASDRPALLVKWLSELNYLHVTEHLLFGRFEIEKLHDGEIEATVHGEAVDPDRHVVHTEVKAVTYHGLEIQQTPDGWLARVILDL